MTSYLYADHADAATCGSAALAIKGVTTKAFTLGDDYTADVLGGASNAYKVDFVLGSIKWTVYQAGWVNYINSNGAGFEGWPSDFVLGEEKAVTGLASCGGENQKSAGYLEYGFVDIDLDATPITVEVGDSTADGALDGSAADKRPVSKSDLVFTKQ